MPASLDVLRLVQMSHELLLMAWHGVRPKRLGMLALDLLMARESASHLARQARDPASEGRARRALAFIARLEEQVRRLYATHRARPPGLLRLGSGLGLWRG